MAVFVLLVLFIICLIILSSVFWIWMIIDCINNKFLTDTTKAVWILIIVFTHLIGALCYLLAGRKPTHAAYPTPQGLPFQQPNGLYQQRPTSVPRPPYSQSHPGNAQSTINTPYQSDTQHNYNAYQQGYQVPSPGTPPVQESWRQDDEPLATYPELPRQELSQQSNND
jgi:Phospholipase_D-nuclease N-terminal